MIGVIVNEADRDVVCEFFELFKTPWEFYRETQEYDVVLCASDECAASAAKLVIIYSGGGSDFIKQEQECPLGGKITSRFLSCKDDRIPIYGRTLTFDKEENVVLRDLESRKCAAYIEKKNDGSAVVRVGYDLFYEIRTLLTDGQPAANALFPTLELHVAVLRELIINCDVDLVEIPPVPEGYRFIVCLTHDVDHPSICQHKWDHTILGFAYRAIFGSLRKWISGHMSATNLAKNWSAVLKLPLVYMGFAKDFWGEFADRYRKIEQGFCSTFFVIPYKNHPGVAANGPAPSFRASGYAAEDIRDVIRSLISDGHEVGLHGIDAWADSSKGSEEIKEIQRVSGGLETGVRMHWLYYNRNTPEVLEKAGASYDSTFGYNEAVGYRAGATQVYKPLAVRKLLELPLHVMDTALFYPSRLELSHEEAAEVLEQMQGNAVRFGGVLTVNWHDRSLAPERLWDTPYENLLAGLKKRGAWICTANEGVSWFRKRRSARFSTGASAAKAELSSGSHDVLPALKLRTYQNKPASGLNKSSSFYYLDSVIANAQKPRVTTEIPT